jgi:Rieske Fe-S protein
VADELERPGDDVERHDADQHLPSPSIWPFGFALGVALVLLGLIVDWWIAAIGAVIALVFAFLWIRAATREVRGEPEPEPVAPAAEPDEEEEVGPERFPRSVFLEGATLGIGAAIGGIVTLPALGFMVLPAFVDQAYAAVDLGPLENFPPNQWTVTKFRSDPEEPEDVARRTAYVRNNGQTPDGEPSFTILSSRCVHLGCPVRPQGLTDEQTKEVETEGGGVVLQTTRPSGFVCPCHGGSYDVEGNREAGPPVRALDRYEYSIRDARLILGKPYSVGKVDGAGAEATVIAYDLVDPGQHVDGPEQFFYPYVP